MKKTTLALMLLSILFACNNNKSADTANKPNDDSTAAVSSNAVPTQSSELSREDAQKVIMQELRYPKKQSASLRRSFSYSMSYQRNEKQKAINQLYILRDNGYISLSESSGADALGEFAKFQIQVTEKGRPFIMNESGEEYLINSHTEIIKVTGISNQPSNNTAVAEYVVDWEMTPFGNYFYYKISKGTSRPQQISLRRFDDGWRINNTIQ